MDPWKPHLYRVGTEFRDFEDPPDDEDAHRKHIEPWLSAVFQSEHLSLLVGSGLSAAVAAASGAKSFGMAQATFACSLNDLILQRAEESAKRCARGQANLEDQIRVAFALLDGFELMADPLAQEIRTALKKVLSGVLNGILKMERELLARFDSSQEGLEAKHFLTSFLLSFASRTASRERLHLFTTNYDRVVEYGSDVLGLRTIDRFVGSLEPVFRSSRLDVDFHYNPPGIRGEPRFLEGVIRFSKLHGSIDWASRNEAIVRTGLPFGAPEDHPNLPSDTVESLLIYPNPAKDLETIAYPYAELFRDFSASICRPNSVLVTYGYGFGDDHINRVIRDALTIPSTHLVIISYDDAAGRIPVFCERVGRIAQISLLIGKHFGDLRQLVEFYLPKPAIDLISTRRAELLKRRLAPSEASPATNGSGGPND